MCSVQLRILHFRTMEETLPTMVNNENLIAQPWKISELLLIALICILLTWYLQLLWSRRNLYLYSWKLPGPFAFPLVGSALHFIGSPYDIFSNLMKMFNQYPEVYRVWFGPRLIYFISDPKYYEILLPHYLNKDRWYKYAEPALGHGLFSAPLDTWKRHRKIIMPTFSQKILDGFVEIFSKQSEVLVEQMKKFIGKGEFDIFHIMSKCTLDIICETAMGVKVNTQMSEDTSLPTSIDRIMENIFLRAFVIWYHIDTIFNLTARSKDYSASVKTLHDFSGSVVRQKKRLFDEARKRRKDTADVFFEEGSKKKAFLDYLIEITSDGNQFSEQELRDEVDTFIIAGSDTTASTNSYVFLMLGLHKDLQEKVYEEIMEVVGPNRPVEKEDLAKLQYMERFIKETLRFFPAGGIVLRAIDEDVDLGDHVIPAGVSVCFGILKTHTNEKYWPDPFRFDPDRFLPEEVSKRHPCTYLPFSYGPRNCVGVKYAMMGMKTLLATVLRIFKVSTSYRSVQDIKLKASLVLRPKDGYKVSLELR